jgi:flagellar biosynthesis protein FliQ
VDAILEHAAVVMMTLSLIPLGAVALGGGVVSLLQAALQVQEQSILHLARLGIFAVLVILGGRIAFHEIEQLFVTVVISVNRMTGGAL